MTNESIRAAVAEFKAESPDFASPHAEAKWGRVADWDVSRVHDFSTLFHREKEFNEDLSLWDVGNATTMHVIACSYCTQYCMMG